jgi:hypothetical protein
MSGTIEEFIRIREEYPYRPDSEDDNPLENNLPHKCMKCGSIHTSSYKKLMRVSGPKGALSGDLIYRPLEVVNCMHCGSTWYHNSMTLRDI